MSSKCQCQEAVSWPRPQPPQLWRDVGEGGGGGVGRHDLEHQGGDAPGRLARAVQHNSGRGGPWQRGELEDTKRICDTKGGSVEEV